MIRLNVHKVSRCDHRDQDAHRRKKSRVRIRFDRIFNRFFPSASCRLNQNPRPLRNQKDDEFSVSEIRIVLPVENKLLENHYLGATLKVSNDLMVKIKLVLPTDYRGSRPSNFLVTTFDVKLTALRCDWTVCAVHILARSWHLILKCTKGRLKRLNSSSVVMKEFEILLKYFPPDRCKDFKAVIFDNFSAYHQEL